jgi:hypothetical protein
MTDDEIQMWCILTDNYVAFTKEGAHVFKMGTVYPDGIDDNLHRENGAATIYPSGLREYCINGKYHREDGPAVIMSDTTLHYYINGEEQ